MAAKRTLLPGNWKKNPLLGPPAQRLERWLLQRSYRLRDRFLDNPRSAAEFAAHPPALSAAQRQVVEALQKDGIAMIPFRALFPDPAVWATLNEEMADFRRRTEEQFERDSSIFDQRKKAFLVRRFRIDPRTFALDDPWLQAGFFFADIVNEYLGLWTKLTEIDHWYTRVGEDDRERVASQRWHRDPEDRKLVKVFMYFSDVDADSGPFEYIPGTGPGGIHEKRWPWVPSVSVYPPAEQIEAAIPTTQWQTCSGSAGTVVFCNTSGLHRGGFCKSKPRILATWKFLSPAALASYEKRILRTAPLDATAPLSPAARYLIS